MEDSDTQHVIKVYDRDNKQIQSEVIYQNSVNDDDDEKAMMQDENFTDAFNGGQRLRQKYDGTSGGSRLAREAARHQ